MATNWRQGLESLLAVDEMVVEIHTALDEADVLEDTIIIFTSDNGGLMGPTHNAPLRAGKGTPYEGGIRVPLIIRWPAVVKRRQPSITASKECPYGPKRARWNTCVH